MNESVYKLLSSYNELTSSDHIEKCVLLSGCHVINNKKGVALLNSQKEMLLFKGININESKVVYALPGAFVNELYVSDNYVLLGGSDNNDEEDNKHNNDDIVASAKANTHFKQLHNMPPLDESLYNLHDKISKQQITNIFEAIKYWVDKQPNKVAYHWIDKTDGKVTKSFTYGEVWKKIESIAYYLTNEWDVKKGEHVFIVYPPGLEFIFAHFGCMLAGCVSVPVYPPIPGRTLKKGVEKLKLLQKSCNARIALTSRTYNLTRKGVKITSFKTKWPKLKWYTTDTIKWKTKYAINEININPNSLAFLQYTSGSTGDPKGVMILHRNILHNTLVAIQNVAVKGINTVGLCWVPQYHDMGLIGCYTTAVCAGATQYSLSPFTFLQNPSVWIHCMSRYKCNVTTAPNFAFELVVRKWHEPKDGHKIDLINMQVIGSGGEPIRVDTVTKFHNLFQNYGLNRGVVHPVFGIAESCLYVSTDHHILTHVDTQEVQRVCTGNVDMVLKLFDVDIRIINPETGDELNDNEEGEVIISSQSIAAGYMNRSELSKEVFQFQLSKSNNNRTYLRTGDLGMIVKPDREWSIANPDRHPIYGQDDKLLEDELNQRHLVITGRIKDLIIINGRNYYPQDIELCVEHSLTDERLVRSGCVVATSIEWKNEETAFGVICELRKMELEQHISEKIHNNKQLTKNDVLRSICLEMIKAIHNEFGVKPAVIALIKEKTIPKTTSGKVRRKATAAALLAGDQLKLIYQFEVGHNIKNEPNLGEHTNSITNVEDANRTNDIKSSDNNDIKLWNSLTNVKTRIKELLNELLLIDDNENQSEYDDYTPFSELGLASLDLVNFGESLCHEFNMDIDATSLYNYTNIQHLSEYIFAVNNGMTMMLRSPSKKYLHRIENRNADLAIVSMSCRLPGKITNPLAFWNALIDATDLVKSGEEFGRHDLDRIGCGLSNEIVESFDNTFFGLSKMEAEQMDPQQRLLLTTAWEVCYNAGYTSRHSMNGINTGVFIGIASNDYIPNKINAFSSTSAARSIASNRISYSFGLNGPSMTIDTACSSVLVALRTAVLSIHAGDCDSAIIGGVNIINKSLVTRSFKSMGVLSPRKRCNSFDFQADGYIRSEACGMFMLMKLDDARDSNLPILAVYKGSAITSNGAGATLTAPKQDLQSWTISKAVVDANINYVDIVEAHGTGTPLGDAIELQAIRSALLDNNDESEENSSHPLIVTTAKPNVGHSEAASGAISIIKSILQLNYRCVPGLLHYTESIESVNMSNMLIPNTLYKFEFDDGLLVTGINSFGFGGTNAHVILQSHTKEETQLHFKEYLWKMNRFESQPTMENHDNINDAFNLKLPKFANNTDGNKVLSEISYIMEQHMTNDNKFDPDQSFIDMGISSLSLTMIATELSDQLDKTISLSTILQFKNARELANAISLKSQGELSGIYSEEFWNNEVYLPDDINMESFSETKINSDIKDVFLTGATGFLGGQVLLELMLQTNANIHCLIRAKNIDLAYERLYKVFHQNEIPRQYLNRTVCYVGDLSKSRLNLEDQFDELAMICDTVVHCGAIVDWILPYERLKAANVNGTIEVIRFATTKKLKRIHYISTEGILPRLPDLKPVTENEELSNAAKLNTGYRQSKWVAEKIVQVAISRNIPIHGIYRTGVIAGHNESGFWAIDDAYARSIQTNTRLANMPDISTGMLPVNFLAKAIICGVVNGKLNENGPTYHMANSQPVDIVEWSNVANEMGFRLDKIPYETWRENVFESKDESLRVIPIIHVVDHEPYTVATPLDPTQTDKWLSDKHGLKRPQITPQLMRLYSEWVFTHDIQSKSYHFNSSKATSVVDLDKQLIGEDIQQLSAPVASYSRHLIQFVWWLFVLLALGAMFLPVITVMRYVLHEYGSGLSYMTLALFGGGIIYAFELIIFTVLCKWLILGRSKPGTHRVWSLYFIRWWCVSSLIRLTNMFVGFFLQNTAYYPYFLRLLGANIGDRVIIDTTQLEDIDLLTIGDDIIIEGLSRISCNKFDINSNDEPVLILGEINIGSNCIINHKCTIEPSCIIEDNVELLSGTYVSNGLHLLEQSVYKGSSHCIRVKEYNSFEIISKVSIRLLIFSHFETMLLHLLAMLLYVFLGCVFITIALYPTNWIYDENNTLGAAFFLSILPVIVMYEYAIAAVIIKWLLIGQFKVGNNKVFSSTLAVRIWFVDRFMIALSINQWILGANAIYMDWLYWLLGQSCGYYCMRSNAYFGGCCIDLIKLGERVIIGNNVMFVPYKYEGHKIIFQQIHIENDVLIGGQTVIYGDVCIGKKGVIGANSCVHYGTHIKSGDMCIEDEVRFHTNIHNEDLNKSNNPSHIQYVLYGLLVPLLMHIIRLICCLPSGWLLSEVIIEESEISDWQLHTFPQHWKLIPMSHWAVITFEYLYFIAALLFVLVTAIIARLLSKFNTNKNNSNLYDSDYYKWRMNLEMLSQTLLQKHAGISMLINGTELLSTIGTLFGAKIGRNVYWNPSFISDMNIIEIGDSSVLNQCYLWPNTIVGIHFRVMDRRKIIIHNNCVIEYNTQLFPNAHIGALSAIHANSVLYPGQYINTISKVYGNPAIMELRDASNFASNKEM